MTADKPLTATELREALRLVAAEVAALPTPSELQQPATADAYLRTCGALDALLLDLVGANGSALRRWALEQLRERAAQRAGTGPKQPSIATDRQRMDTGLPRRISSNAMPTRRTRDVASEHL